MFLEYISPRPTTRFLDDDPFDSPTADRVEDIARLLADVPISVFSTDAGPNESRVTASAGQIGVERGPGAIKLWLAQADGPTSWVPIAGGTDPSGAGTESPPDTGTPGGAIPSHSHGRADLPSEIAYEDEANVFVPDQSIIRDDAQDVRLSIEQVRSGSGSRISFRSPDEDWAIRATDVLQIFSSATTVLRATPSGATLPLLLEVGSDSSISGALVVRGATRLDSSLSVDGESRFSASIFADSDLSIDGGALVRSQATFESGIEVASLSTLSGGFAALSASSISGTLIVRGEVEFTAPGQAFRVEADVPRFVLVETDAAADEGRWLVLANDGNLVYQTQNDAQSIASTVWFIGRTGASPDFVIFRHKIGVLTDSPTEAVDISAATFRLRESHTPVSGTASGNQGDIAWDSSFIYVATSANSWSRATLSTF